TESGFDGQIVSLKESKPKGQHFIKPIIYFWVPELFWDGCVEKPGKCLDSHTENCLSSSVDRFIDTTLTVPVGLPRLYRKEGSSAIFSKTFSDHPPLS
uniref:Mitochondrial import inner membrane translocase subunit n=1 Tax=Theropithecus gelada TaxID=9565 RepID=A0A8D2K5I1_THEGE